MDGMGWGDIIFFGAIAAFIILRYRAMLGEQGGRDQNEIKRDQAERESDAERVIQLSRHGMRETPIVPPKKPEPSQRYDAELEAQFAAMREIDDQFDIEEFKEGAKTAFEMVIDAFNSADRYTLRDLLANDIYKNFDAVLKQRDDENSYPHTTLVAINDAIITAARLDGKKATITVKFFSEQIQVVKNREGEALQEGASELETVEDEWVFERSLSSSNPAWTITQT